MSEVIKNDTISEKNEIDKIISKEYNYDFKTHYHDEYKVKKGISEEIVSEISKVKEEPTWAAEARIKALRKFKTMPNPTYGPNLDFLNYDDYFFYRKANIPVSNDWNDVPKEIKETFEKLGVPENEAKFFSGSHSQFESEVVYEKSKKELSDQGVIFCSIEEGLKKHPEIFKKYFGTVVPYTDNKFAALNSAFYSGGSFVYVPKGVKPDKPIQAYFRINSQEMGQFERTLIIVDDGADIHYVEGCTAPQYSKESLHCGVVEIYVGKNAHCRYTTIQNWSTNIVNLVTQRAKVMDGGFMEWIDGNIGSGVCMIYPSCILAGEGARGSAISVSFAGKGQYQDAGSKMIHLAPNTKSTIISKSICKDGGTTNYRGTVKHSKKAAGANSFVSCDTIILDNISKSDTIPINIAENDESTISHEGTVSKVNDEEIFYLMSRGLTEQEATEMIVMGFIEPFAKELPMEYAVELNQLIKLEMTDSIG